jgi:uncharacterized protein (DUF1330 family)
VSDTARDRVIRGDHEGADVTAYVIVEAFITDESGYDEYKPLAAASIASHGGRYKARGGATEPLEGDATIGRVVVLEFPDRERARAWYDSDEYREARRVRQPAASSRLFIVDGYEPG